MRCMEAQCWGKKDKRKKGKKKKKFFRSSQKGTIKNLKIYLKKKKRKKKCWHVCSPSNHVLGFSILLQKIISKDCNSDVFL